MNIDKIKTEKTNSSWFLVCLQREIVQLRYFDFFILCVFTSKIIIYHLLRKKTQLGRNVYQIPTTHTHTHSDIYIYIN